MDAEVAEQAGVRGSGTRPDEDGSAPVRAGSAVGAGREGWELRAATEADVETIAELRAVVMRPDLERLGRYDEHRVRQRLRDSFSARYTSVVLVDGEFAGCVTVRPAEPGRWLENFYLAGRHQGRGLGTAVLRAVLARTDAEGLAVGLNVLQGSAARRLYERHGFAVADEDPIDVFMIRPPEAGPGAPPIV